MFKSIILLGMLMAILLTGCGQSPITGSGNVVTQEEVISGFDKVEVSHAFKVNISQGETFSVVVRMDDNLFEYLDVVKQGSTLKIGLKTDRISRDDSTREAEVTMPDLTGLDLRGASQVTLTGFKSTNALNLDLSAASHLRGDIEAGDTQIDVSDASQVTLRGSAGDVTMDDVSGASTVDLADFPVVNANVTARDSSVITVNASGTLDVDAKSASEVYYVGNPTLGEIDTSGGSSVEPK